MSVFKAGKCIRCGCTDKKACIVHSTGPDRIGRHVYFGERPKKGRRR